MSTLGRWLFDGPDWRTWLLHSACGLVMALVFAWWFPVAYYALREAEGIVYAGGLGPDVRDHVMDVLCPTAVGLLVGFLR